MKTVIKSVMAKQLAQAPKINDVNRIQYGETFEQYLKRMKAQREARQAGYAALEFAVLMSAFLFFPVVVLALGGI